MATNQESLQESIRTRSGSTSNLTFNEDWLHMFDEEAVAAGEFNERLLSWLNTELVDVAEDEDAPYDTLPAAQSAYAAYKTVTRWSDIRDVT